MRLPKIALSKSQSIIACCVVLIAGLVSWIGGKSFAIKLDVAILVAAPALIGLMLAVVGVYISILMSAYTTFVGVANTREDVRKEFLLGRIEAFGNSAAEAKQNTYLLVILLAASLVIPLTRGFLVPESAWPFKPEWLTTGQFQSLVTLGGNTLSFSLLWFGIWAAVDTVAAMFNAQALMAQFSLELIKSAQPAKVITLSMTEQPTQFSPGSDQPPAY